MISKVFLTQSEVNERRLNTIHNLLEENNFRKAINEADKILNKNSNFYSVKVLKGLALYRLGKQSDAFLIIDEVIKSTPTDENTLNSLTHFYKETKQKNKIVDLYDEVMKKFPDREDICVNLFYYHTKNFDFVSQQNVAKQLTKMNTNDFRYGTWSIICNVLQGIYGQDERLLKIGEAFLARILKSTTSAITVEIVEFFLFTLEKLNKFEESLDWLNGTILKDIVDNIKHKEHFNRYKISLLLKLNRKQETCDLFWSYLQHNVNDVCQWREYIDIVVELNLDDENHEHSIASVIKRLNDFETQAIKIAKIHLSLKLQSSPSLYKQASLKYVGTFNETVVEYFINFGHKQSCLFDIYSFMCLKTVSFDDRRKIVDKIDQLTDAFSLDNVKNTADIERHFVVAVLRRAVGNVTDIFQLLTMYDHCLQFCLNVPDSELKPCDNFLKLIVCCYYDQWYDSGKSNWKPIVDSLLLLERSLSRSSTNYHLRLQLSHLFGLLCCPDLLITQFDELQVKQMMWDTMGHVFVLPMTFVPCFQQRWRFFQRNIDRKRKNKSEIEDGLVNSFKLGSYSKIPELIEFRRNIDVSVMSRFCEIENAYFITVLKSNNFVEFVQCFNDENIIGLSDIFQSQNHDLDVLPHLLVDVKDFRDLNAFLDFGPFDRKWSDTEQRFSFDNIILWLRQRILIIRLLHQITTVVIETTKFKEIKFGNISSFPSSKQIQSFLQSPQSPSLFHEHFDAILFRSNVIQINEIWMQMNSLTESYENLNFNMFGCSTLPQKHFSFAYLETVKACSESISTFYDAFVRNLQDIEFSDWITMIGGPTESFLVNKLLAEEDQLCSEDNFLQIVPLIIARLTVMCEIFSLVTLFMSMMEEITKPLELQFCSRVKSKKKRAELLANQSASLCEGIGQKYNLFISSTNLHGIPSYFIDLALTIKKFVIRIKHRICQVQYNDLVLISISSSWKSTLDEASNFINLKKDHLQISGNFFQNNVS